MWNDRFAGDPCSVRARACFDPLTLTAGTLMEASLGATAAGGALSAAGTIAGGSAAKQAGQMQQQASYAQAEQLDQNASQAVASGQRQMFDTQQKTRLAISSSRAAAGANGTDAGFGSPVANEAALAKRGSYHAAMDMFNGESTASGIRNQGAGVRYSGDAAAIEGDEKQTASYLAAAGTLAGSAGSMFKTYGQAQYPSSFRTA